MNQQSLKLLRDKFGLSDRTIELGEEVLQSLKEEFEERDRIAEFNQYKVLHAMQKNRLGEEHFMATTGYGYNDIGRETLEAVYADTFGAEAALVRPQITCGTHALTVALFGILRPGDELLSPVGKPYDTLEEVIGIRGSMQGSLKDFGISYRETPLLPDGSIDYEGVRASVNSKTRLVTIQRSKGYSERPSIPVEEIGRLIRFLKELKPDILCMVDNCYGEFVEEKEPTEVGADLIVGSLIKNPGGGLAPIGGYLAGRKELIEAASYRLSAPGLGQELGANLGILPSFFQGFFLAPAVVASATKTAMFAAKLYERLGYEVFPTPSMPRTDIIQAITFHNPEQLIAFCEAVQKSSPVDSYVNPIPWDMPGYDSQVIMAAGNFVSGSSIELSADGPIREPYTVFFQGGLTFWHGKLGILRTVEAVESRKSVHKSGSML